MGWEYFETTPCRRRARPGLRDIIGEMIRHKETHFAGYKRAVINWEVVMTKSGPHLSVMSTLDSV